LRSTYSKGKNQTKCGTTAAIVAGESDSVKDLVRREEEGIVVSQEFRQEDEYEYTDNKSSAECLRF
jgi:hypothetical protein